MIENIFGITFDLFGPLSVISILAMGFYLYRNKLCTLWQLRTAGFWLELFIKYREHTKSTNGYIGIWFYVAIVSIVLSLISGLYLFFAQGLIPMFKEMGTVRK